MSAVVALADSGLGEWLLERLAFGGCGNEPTLIVFRRALPCSVASCEPRAPSAEARGLCEFDCDLSPARVGRAEEDTVRPSAAKGGELRDNVVERSSCSTLLVEFSVSPLRIFGTGNDGNDGSGTVGGLSEGRLGRGRVAAIEQQDVDGQSLDEEDHVSRARFRPRPQTTIHEVFCSFTRVVGSCGMRVWLPIMSMYVFLRSGGDGQGNLNQRAWPHKDDRPELQAESYGKAVSNDTGMYGVLRGSL